MHTARVSNLRSALEEYYNDDNSDWLSENYDPISRQGVDPHIFEHQARAEELLADDDADAAIIHQLLGSNMLRAARDSN